jgi:hypothetical protein
VVFWFSLFWFSLFWFSALINFSASMTSSVLPLIRNAAILLFFQNGELPRSSPFYQAHPRLQVSLHERDRVGFTDER